MTSQLTRKWRITFENGFIIECFRERKPTRLAESWSRSCTEDAVPYGSYTIAEHGLFNKGILALHRNMSELPKLPPVYTRPACEMSRDEAALLASVNSCVEA